MAEDAGAADLIAGGRLQLGISRGSPEQVIDGYRYFGYQPPEGMTDADMAREHAKVFLEVLKGQRFAPAQPAPDVPPTRPACSAPSGTRRGCGTASGGAPGHARPPSGRPGSA
jgi:alkanesulfonate monooxygenase SsuD/methylene tetrahydromethanopterin reductase-like flavin-dependent oxidoreductase (luciferase family)